MTRSESADPTVKSSKRKGTRSVSTLTPSQLARKRANDREAQRAIRARTKEHIERLESELEELKGQHGRDRTIQGLLRRNKALEDELARLRESMGISITSSPYSASAVYEDNQSVGSGAAPSPRQSPLMSSTDYHGVSDFSQQHYVPLPNNCEHWAATVPNALSSNVSSPSSTGNDDYVAAYIPTSVPSSMMPSANSVHATDNRHIKCEYGNMSMHPLPPSGYMGQPPSHGQQQNSNTWQTQMYNMYYPAQISSRTGDYSNNVCIS